MDRREFNNEKLRRDVENYIVIFYYRKLKNIKFDYNIYYDLFFEYYSLKTLSELKHLSS